MHLIIIYEEKDIELYKHEIEYFKRDFWETLSKDKLFGEKFVELNRNKCKIIINEKEVELSSYLDNLKFKNGLKEIKLKGINNLNDISYMFCGCVSLKLIKGLENLNMNNIININSLLNNCKKIKIITWYFKLEY